MTGAKNSMDQTSQGHEIREGKYLTFSLSGEEYGIGILKVKELIGMLPIRTMPQAPSHVKGVINLRGKVIPIVDLRLKFSLAAGEYTDRTCIVVVEVEGTTEGKIQVGCVVDSVSEVLNIKGGDIEDAPVLGAGGNSDIILGMAKVGGSVKILLDIDRVFRGEDLAGLREAA